MAKRKLIVVLGTGSQGGIQSVIAQHLNAIEHFGGYSVKFLPSHIEGSPMRRVMSFLTCLGQCLAVALSFRFGRKFQNVLFHAHMSMRGSVYRKACLLVLSRMFSIKFIIHVHGSEIEQFHATANWFSRTMLDFVFCRSDTIIVLSEAMREYVETTFGAETLVLSNFVYDSWRTRDFDRKWEGIKDGREIQVIFIGALIPRKGCNCLIEACLNLWRDCLDGEQIRLLILGDGPERESLEKLAGHEVTAGKITFAGWMQGVDKENAMFASDILVLPSYAEGLPMAIVESMAAGASIVATDVGGVASMVSRGEGALFEPGNVVELTNILSGYLQNRGQLVEAMRASRITFLSRYELQLNAKRLEEIYSDTFI